ncbi:MAG TPA: hypothetical protein O0X19_05375 [Methanocorpusculum sp.]|nr:hypothetical protein [Methanocorpusculum sp.]
MRKGTLIVIIVVAILVIFGCVGFVAYNNTGHDTPVQTAKNPSGAGLGFEDDQGDVVKKGSSGITIPGWKELAIDAGTTEVYVDFYNPASNEGKFHMTFELKLAATGETLYASKLVKAGDHIKKITLTRPLEKGTYDAVIHVQPYTADEALTLTNNADIKLTLIVG